MEYTGPDAADLGQVASLNLAFLDHLASAGRPLLGDLPPDLAATLGRTGAVERERIAKCPFLLFSLAERDDKTWRRLFDGPLVTDLVDTLRPAPPGELRIVTAALAFLWHFSARNPYAARVVTGAPAGWCERLADCALVQVFEFAAHQPGILALRHRGSAPFWRRLLLAGVSDEACVRRAARITLLQSVLTRPDASRSRSLPAAACAMAGPDLRVAERASVSPARDRRYNTPPHEGPVDTTTRKNVPKR